MKIRRIIVKETLSRVVEVVAASDWQAIETVRHMYRNSEIVLDASDYESTEFCVTDEKEKI